MLFQMRQARDGLFHAWPMAGRHPPQRDGRSLKMLEPVGATAVEALVYGLPDEVLQRGDVFPDRQIDDDERVSKRPRVGGVAAVVDIAPDETGAARGEAIHQLEIVGELGHAGIVELVFDPADVQLGKMMTAWLLQGPAPWSAMAACRQSRQRIPADQLGCRSRPPTLFQNYHLTIPQIRTIVRSARAAMRDVSRSSRSGAGCDGRLRRQAGFPAGRNVRSV